MEVKLTHGARPLWLVVEARASQDEWFPQAWGLFLRSGWCLVGVRAWGKRGARWGRLLIVANVGVGMGCYEE